MCKQPESDIDTEMAESTKSNLGENIVLVHNNNNTKKNLTENN